MLCPAPTVYLVQTCGKFICVVDSFNAATASGLFSRIAAMRGSGLLNNCLSASAGSTIGSEAKPSWTFATRRQSRKTGVRIASNAQSLAAACCRH